MSYCLVEQIKQDLARGSQLSGTGASLTEEVIGENIDLADQEINGKLSSIFKTPFDPVPPLISQISRAVAGYLCDLTFREIRDYQSELNPVVLRYKRAQELLKGLASGAIDLPGVEPSSDNSAGGQIVATFGTDPLFCDSDFDLHCYRPANRVSGAWPSSDCYGIW